MRLTVIPNKNASRVFIHFGKNSQIRLRLPVVEHLQIKKGDYILAGTDEKEKDKPTAIYFVKAKNIDHRGHKVSNGNGAHHFSAISLIKHFNIKVPASYPYEMLNDEDNGKMIKIII